MRWLVIPFLFAPAAFAGAFDARGAVILCYESVDGSDTKACALEGELRKMLQSEGATLVDQAQAARLRATYTPERFAAGANLAGVDLLDADIGVVVRARVTTLATIGKVSRFQSELTVDVIDPARATILVTRTQTANVQALNGTQATAEAAKSFRDKELSSFKTELITALNAPVQVELWVFDLPPGMASVQGIEGALDKSGKITAQRRTAYDRGVGRWRITLAKGATPDAIASHLEGAGLLLSVQGSTGGMVQLAYKPDAHIKMPCALDVKAKKGVPAWLAENLEGLAGHALLGTGWITPTSPPAATTATVAINVEPVGAGKIAVAFALKRNDGKQLAATRKTGKADDAPALVNDGVTSLLDAFKKYLSTHPTELSEIRRVLDAPRVLDIAVKVGKDGALEGAALRDDTNIGTLEIATSLDEARIRSSVAGITPPGAWRKIDGKRGVVALEAPAPLLAIHAISAVRVEVELEGRIGERMYREHVAVPLLYRPPQTVDRERIATLARLVDPRPSWAQTLIVPALADAPAVPTAELGRAARVWDRIAAQGVTVEGAPADERFAVVATPTSVLIEQKGDALALAALCATAFEAAGLETRLVKTPTAFLVAVDAGPKMPDMKGSVNDDGRVFVPVDPTALDRDFWFAVERGTAEVARNAARKEVASTRVAWTTEKPISDARAVTDRSKARAEVKVLVTDPRGTVVTDDQRRLIASTLAKSLAGVPGLKVLSNDDLRVLLDAEAARQAVGCADSSCLAEIAGAVGARFFVAVDAGKLGRDYALSVTVTDTKDVAVLERVQLREATVPSLVDNLPRTAARLAGAALGAEGIVASGPWAYEAFRARVAGR